MDLTLTILMLLVSVIHFAAWRSPRTSGGEDANNVRALKAAGWLIFGIWYCVRFIAGGGDLQISAVTSVALFMLVLADLLAGTKAMSRAKNAVANKDANGPETVVH